MHRTLRRARRIGAVLVVAVIALFGAWRGFRCHVGSPRDLLDDRWHIGTRIVDRDGRLLYFAPSAAGLRGTPAELEDMGERIIPALLVAEDRRFYEHDGVDRRALLRASIQVLSAGRIISGGSTITQQLVEMLDAAGYRVPTSFGSKLREIARAQNLEEELGKREILAAYLNRAPFGNGIVGVGAAANAYFGKSLAELSWAQAALLAVLPRAPSALDPIDHLDRALRRQRRLLLALHQLGHLDARELETALWEPIRAVPPPRPFRAPHLSLRALAANDGDAEVGSTPPSEVVTSIDGSIQDGVEQILRRHLPRLEQRGAQQAAAIVVDVSTGQVVAYAGSAGWDDPDGGKLDMVQSRRSAGSILKPFGYALAYQDGLRPSDLLADVPAAFAETQGTYAPQNIDAMFLGPLPAAEALALSRNVPAVRVGERVGTDRLLTLLREVGFRGLTQSAEHYGAALILGGAEVSLWEVAGAYTCLSRSGECISLTWSREGVGDPHRAISEPAADLVAENLSNPAWRVRFLQAGLAPTRFDLPVGTKTGTSQHNIDTWAVGFSDQFVVAAWAGNPDGTPTTGLVGANGAGPIAMEMIELVSITWHDGGPGKVGWPSRNLEPADVCPLSGQLATEACPENVGRLFDPRQMPASPCPLHRTGTVMDAREAEPRFVCAPAGRSRAVVLPAGYSEWFEQRSDAVGTAYVDGYGYRWFSERESSDCKLDPSSPNGSNESR